MSSDLPFALMSTGAVVVGLWLSNILYDLKVPHYISRKVGHSAGGLAYLMAVLLFSSAVWPIILASFFTLLLLSARVIKPVVFRGVGGSARRKSYSEVWFALVAVPVFSIAWLWLNQPFIALASLLFMAWGDCVTGITRSQVYEREVKGIWGSVAMLTVCLAISWAFLEPFWIGAVGSLVAVAAEWAFGSAGVVSWGDDNWAIPLASMGAMLFLMSLGGSS